MIHNPILPGFYPDPSICRVGDDFYMVTSSFSYYPGVPIFHSKDLAHWEQLGHVLNRPEQLPCGYEMLSGGIFAPTIRYHEGVYYMITTNMSLGEKNFIVTALDPAGPWSDIHVIEGADGIDPSLFFDDDGRAYYTGTTRVNEGDHSYPAIWGQEIDLKAMKLVGQRKILWRGAMINAASPEGPHIYKKDGWYYLMIAEGGTEHMHAVTIGRCSEVLGSYEGYPGNPILTHRHLGKMYPICNVGHADLVELQDGSWYMVCLASRLMDGYHKILGRETFMVPVVWEDEWPVVNPGRGHLEDVCPKPACLQTWMPEGRLPFDTDTDFDEATLGLEWNEIGTPSKPFYKLEDSKLKLKLLKNELVPWEFDGASANIFERMSLFGQSDGKVSFIGRRQQHVQFVALTALEFEPEMGECAGLTVIQNDANQIRLEYRKDADGQKTVRVITTRTVIRDGKQCLEKETEASVIRDGRQYFEEKTEGALTVTQLFDDKLYIKLSGNGTKYSYYICTDGLEWTPVAKDVDCSWLGSETSGGFIGAYIGMYAYNDMADKDKYAAFEGFVYKEIK